VPLGCREAGGELERSLGLATVFFVEEGHEQQVAIPVGAFADSQFPVPTVSVYEKRRHSWVSLPDNVEHAEPPPGQQQDQEGYREAHRREEQAEAHRAAPLGRVSQADEEGGSGGGEYAHQQHETDDDPGRRGVRSHRAMITATHGILLASRGRIVPTLLLILFTHLR
jgi:hypothetical protein